MPRTFTFDINLEGCASQVPSWKARLGLAQFLDEKVWPSWKISAIDNPALMELDVDGVYKLLPQCGTANSNLHVRESGNPDHYRIWTKSLGFAASHEGGGRENDPTPS